MILNLIKDKNRGVKIILLGILPRNGADIDQRIIDTNAIIRGYADNLTVFWLDMAEQYRQSVGTVRPNLFTDGLHLSRAGYEVWAATMNPLFMPMVNNPLCP